VKGVARALVRATSALVPTRECFPTKTCRDESRHGKHERARHIAQRGVTLIELMIAITLVATLSTGMLMAIRTSLITLEKTDARLQSNRRVMSAQQILSHQISGVIPVMGNCPGSEGGAIVHGPFFNGTAQTLRLVSTYSLAEGSRGDPRILEFQVIPLDGGGVRLIVNEHLYSGPASTVPFCASSAQANPQSFVLADRLEYCRFVYHEMIPESPAAANWIPLWNRPNLPSAVRIEMAPLIIEAGRLPVLGVTVPIHITREVGAPYEDFQ
jgi:prepilin-type N-terminal cleavage/methylation domain-containing protein